MGDVDREKNLAGLVLEAAQWNAAMHRDNLCAAGDDVPVTEQQRLTAQLGESLKHLADAADRVAGRQ